MYADVIFVAPPPELLTVLANAVKESAPDARTSVEPSLAAAIAGPGSGALEMLVLFSADAPAVKSAAAVFDSGELPRWAVVNVGAAESAGVETVSMDQATPAGLAAAFRRAIERHTLVRENLRLRGDLRTIASRVSHDLRTPLGCISTTAEVINETLADDGSGDVTLTRAITDSAGEMAALIDRVSFVTKATASPKAPEKVEMGDVVLTALQLLERQAVDAQAELIEPEEWPEVSGVAPWLRVVCWNLIRNALVHAGSKPRIELGWERRDAHFVFWVADNGGGVAPEKHAKLFRPFNLLHQPDTLHGLGLPVVRRLVELQGGTCGYTPRPEGGAKFFFTLPGAR